MRQLAAFFVIFSVLGLQVHLAIAADQASSNFQVEQTTTTVPMRAVENSTNFSVDSGVTGILGRATSGSFLVNSNETQPSGGTTPTPTPTPSGGGGGGGVVVIPTVGQVTLLNDVTCPVYKSSVSLSGGKDTNVERVEVNKSTAGVEYATSTTWQKKSHSLVVGKNTLEINGVTDGARGQLISKEMMRNIPGDINGDGVVDDFDLSILVSNWSKKICKADFNKDGQTDDFDLSILVSSWLNKI